MQFFISRRNGHALLALAAAAWGGSAAAVDAGAVDDGLALIQQSLGEGGGGLRFGDGAAALREDAAEAADGETAPPPLADGHFEQHFRRAGRAGGPAAPPGRAGGAEQPPGVARMRVLGELARFGGSFSTNRSLEDCRDFPKTCAPPFTCEKHEVSTRKSRKVVRLATEDGRANVHSWCGYPRGYVRYAQQCAAGNLFHAAQELRRVQEDRRRPDGSYPLLIMDAAYCFASGHCNDTDVTLHTTIPQAETMCDARYTRRAWTGVGPLAMAASPKRRGTDSAWAKVACAMGTYHCDIVYCRIYYCKDTEWRARFGHLAQSGPLREPNPPPRMRKT